MSGKLLVLEGAEGVGKTTQSRLLVQWLEGAGHDVVAVREPGGTEVGDRVRDIVLHTADGAVADTAEALLYIASRAQLVDRIVVPSLARGAIVVLDRFFLSTYAYQIVGRGLPEAEVRAANRLAIGSVVPDLTLMLTLPVAEALARVNQRGAHDRLERADRPFHDRVAAAFATFADPSWQRAHPETGPIEAITASGGVPEVFQRIANALQRRWPETFSHDRRQRV